jgi:DNA-binding CsgD family transcriptional regulator
MSFYSNNGKLAELYSSYLSTIGKIKFTSREVDIISCLAFSRSDKKIAHLLSISPKTVQAHMYNLMNKLGCSSRDSVIDFIEKNNAIKLVREYYYHLQIKSEFHKLLNIISREYIKDKIVLYYNRDETLNIDTKHYNDILKNLEKANITLKPIHNNQNQIFDVNSISQDNFYIDFIEQLKQVIDNQEFNSKALNYFLEIYKSFSESTEVQVIEQLSSVPSVVKSNNKYFIILFILLMVIGIFIFFTFAFYETDNNNSLKHHSEILLEIKKYRILPNNTDIQIAQINTSNIKKIEDLINPESDDIIKLFYDTTITNKDISDFIYFLNSLSAFYTFHENSGVKARKILVHARNIMEHYVNSRRNEAILFDQVPFYEIETELEYFPNFPQLYTTSTYMLGRSYIYDNNIKQSIKYLELSEKLGKKLNMFESYLSLRNGIYLVKFIQAEKNFEDNDISQGLELIRELKIKYQNLLNDNNRYILNYSPSGTQIEYINPSEDIVSKIECTNRIIRSLFYILKYTNNKCEESQSLIQINKILFGQNDNDGIFDSISRTNSRKIAEMYISIGYIFLEMHVKNSKEHDLIKNINLKLNLNTNNPLEISKELFENAIQKSKKSDFTRKRAEDALELTSKY